MLDESKGTSASVVPKGDKLKSVGMLLYFVFPPHWSCDRKLQAYQLSTYYLTYQLALFNKSESTLQNKPRPPQRPTLYMHL